MTSGEEEQLRSALTTVRADLAATLPGWSGLRIHVVSDEYDVVVYVADRDGAYWGGGPPLEGSSPRTALFSVADGVQDHLAEVHRVIWPVCPTHGWGVHVRPAGTGADWTPDSPDAWAGGAPTWWCRGGSGHDLALIGQLR